MDKDSKCFVMLSQNIKSIKPKELVGDWYVSEKHDGIRAIWDGKDLLTRAKRKFSFVPEWFIKLLPEFPLEGEIIVPGKPFTYFSGVTVVKTDDPRWNEVVFMIFDTPVSGITFNKRFDKIKEFVKKSNSKHISHIECTLVKQIEKPENMKIIHDKYNSIVKNGREGVMIIRSDNLYQPKRVKTILKYKKECEGECEVIGYLEGKGKYEGVLGKLMCKHKGGGPTFNIGGGFIDIQRQCYKFSDSQSDLLENSQSDHDFKELKRVCTLTQPTKPETNSLRDPKCDPRIYEPVPKIGDIVTYQCMEIIPKTGIPRMAILKGIRYDFD